MNTTHPTLLRAFRHPLMLGSILLLLANDHLFKAYAPSWLTGKLSDFAGLFFFPFLLALVMRRATRSEDRALRWGMLLTGLVFGAIKTIPAANEAAVSAARLLLGPSMQMVLDPTDLLALAMLPAGRWFWERLRVRAEPTRSGRRAYAGIALGALAALASTLPPPVSPVTRVIALDGKIYAGVERFCSESYVFLFALSDDQKTWNAIPEPPAPLLAAFQDASPALLKPLCDPNDSQACYQIDGQGRLLESADGGQTWNTGWQYPQGRDAYMRRALTDSTCEHGPDMRFYDLAAAPGPGGATIVAAAGNQGVLIRRGSEGWTRMAVDGSTKPTPTQSPSLDHAFSVTAIEFIFAGCASLLAYTILSVLGRRHVYQDENGKTKHPDWALHPFWFVLAWLLALPALRFAVPEDSLLLPTIGHFAVYALVLMLLVLAFAAAGESGARQKAGLLALLLVFAVLALPVTVFLLWAFGVITDYQTALILAVAITLPVAAWLFYRFYKTLPEKPFHAEQSINYPS